MSKTKIWLIAAAALTLSGILLFVGVMTMSRWNFLNLSTVKYTDKSYAVSESFKDIEIATDASIVFLPSNGDKVEVLCRETIKTPHTVKVEADTLKIEQNDHRSWFDHIGIFTFGREEIKVLIPAGEYGALMVSGTTGDARIPADFKFSSADIDITTGDIEFFATVTGNARLETTTGDATVRDVTAESMEITLTTGDIHAASTKVTGALKLKVSTGATTLSDISCGSLESRGTTGSATLKNVITAEKMNITRTTGSVKLSSSDAAEIYIKVTTGDITGSLLSGKTFIADTTTGSITLPEKTEHLTGGRCELRATTGSINITVE